MLKLVFALWRRDVAGRRLELGRERAKHRTLLKLQQRRDRWQAVATWLSRETIQ